MIQDELQWWSSLYHQGMLLDLPRLGQVLEPRPATLTYTQADQLRRKLASFTSDPSDQRTAFISFFLETICGFYSPLGVWHRGTKVDASWTRRGITGEAIRPDHLWVGPHGSLLPVFVDQGDRLGAGRARRVQSYALQWLRTTGHSLAVLTNGHQWRIIFAGLDFEALVEWDISQWFIEGEPSQHLDGLRAFLRPVTWHSRQPSAPCPLLTAIRDSRKGQAELSQVLGERVRQATELLIQSHAPALATHPDLPAADIYRAGVRMIMRLVVILFTESRDGLVPYDNLLYRNSYSLQGLRELLLRSNDHRRSESFSGFPRILSLLNLIYAGCAHEALPVPAYGGELFAPGDHKSKDAMSRALHVFENACLHESLMSDLEVHRVLCLLTQTKIKVRQGRGATWVSAPVDFSGLSNEYIGILYEGLLDFELRQAADNEPVVFLAVGNEPALPLATLEQMDDAGIRSLVEKLKDKGTDDSESEEESEEAGDEPTLDDAEPVADQPDETTPEPEPVVAGDVYYTVRARAEAWARKVCLLAGLVAKPRGKQSPEKQAEFDRAVTNQAKQLIAKIVLPGEWYLVRWGSTRKGSGSFYTRPALAVPTVHRTLRPLAYDAPFGADGKPNTLAPAHEWHVKPPEAILSLKVCDPACGSGSFPLAALRFLTQALYESLQKHGRFKQHNGRDVMALIMDQTGTESLLNEVLPCRPTDDSFEPRVKAMLRRYVVERCIYGVDLDPLAVELCRLSLWIETLDRRLPMTFLQHKIKSGNSLVGAWFDQFLHYPVMAWEREAGDKNHTNGVHFAKEQWTKAIKEFAKKIRPDLIHLIDGSLYKLDFATGKTIHDAAETALQEIHQLGIAQVQERAEKYQAIQQNLDFQRLKRAFNLWCALWFWPAEALDHAPLPSHMAQGAITEAAWAVVERLAATHRFFHWELEFPDVFNNHSHGFNAILGNPPWEISKPSSKEFFSAIDPLYRGYGKQDALGMQQSYFQRDSQVEHRWLSYSANFKSMSNWVKYAGFPFGSRVSESSDGKKSHDLSLGERGRSSFESSKARHERWHNAREKTSGYADVNHSFRHQGSADVNLYKLFLEQAHALLSDTGRLGFIIPSGLYSDFGTGDLRKLFIDHCRWEWLFGFENREGIFDIHKSFKFNPVIIAKGGQTDAIRTAFMRRDPADWESAESHATNYLREQVVQFSPHSRAILEIQSQRDLDVLTKIYANSVLLGDQSEKGWGIQYTREFDMTNDSKLFPSRPKWEEWGYQPDEYSRWIKGPWRPIQDLYTQMGIDPSTPSPINPVCAQEIEQGIASGEVAKTPWALRCAQPPYDRLPIPRADIPAGIILSRDASQFIREEEIPVVAFTDASGKPLKIKVENDEGKKQESDAVGPAIALPMYQGVMVGPFDPSKAGWVSGTGLRAKWTPIGWNPKHYQSQFLVAAKIFNSTGGGNQALRVGFRDIARTTDTRTMISCLVPALPCGNKVPFFTGQINAAALQSYLNSYAYDWTERVRQGSTSINYFIASETPIPTSEALISEMSQIGLSLGAGCVTFAPFWNNANPSIPWKSQWALLGAKRLQFRCVADALAAMAYGISIEGFKHILESCDLPKNLLAQKDPSNSKGFWRVDKDLAPEHRHTTLAVVALSTLIQCVHESGGDVALGLNTFMTQNDGQGWLIPTAVRLADYGLGHDDRANEPQAVRPAQGPALYDWQLAQSTEESWKECHLHAKNLLGAVGYSALINEIQGAKPAPSDKKTVTNSPTTPATLFDP